MNHTIRRALIHEALDVADVGAVEDVFDEAFISFGRIGPPCPGITLDEADYTKFLLALGMTVDGSSATEASSAFLLAAYANVCVNNGQTTHYWPGLTLT